MIRLDSVSKQHGHQILFLDASMSAFVGEKIGLVGPNGAGKSTVFRLFTGEEQPDSGAVVIEGKLTLGYFSQDVGEMDGCTVVAATIVGAGEVGQIVAELHELESAMADPEQMDELERIVTRYGELQSRFDELGGYSLDARARAILGGLGFSQARMEQDVGELSGGWKMRVAIARILLMAPDVLLLDEPTNHLDIESIIWLEQFLREFSGALIITSHDQEFLNRVVTKIVEIDGGEMTTYSGNYDFYEQQRALREVQADAQFARQQAMLAKEKAFIARFKARASHAAQVQSRIKKIDKIDLVGPPKRRKLIEFEFREPPRSGDDVVTLTNIHKAYGDQVLYRGFDILIRRGERWCLMGVNGAGKSTLLKLISGHATPDQGEIKVGASVKMGYFAQHAMEILSPMQSVIESLETSFPMATIGSLKKLAGAFGFPGDQSEKSCSVLSGGEKVRVVLAKMLYEPPNFLVLDEPTNHLDMETKEVLVRALSSFEGTMLFVSHDRRFLSKLSNRVLELDGGETRTYGGGYAEYVEESGQEAPGVH
jgi:ATPase subunit of ABC transporter with duplicated ATPase domains